MSNHIENVATYHQPSEVELYKLFDADYYSKQTECDGDPLTHYKTVGCRSGKNPHPLFSTSYYLRKYGSQMPDGMDPLTHFFSFGVRQCFETHPLFDAAAYFSARPELAKLGLHPVFHYLEQSATDCSEQSAFFDYRFYVANNPAVLTAGFKPLVHYLAFGWQESLRPHRDFDVDAMMKIFALDPAQDPYSTFIGDLLAPNTAATKPKQHQATTISIVILNYNKSLYTLQCIHRIEHSDIKSDYEIIIVDNGSTDAEFAMLAKYARNVQIIRLSENRFFGEANNIGVEHAVGKYLLFLNNDAFLGDGAVNALLDVLETTPSAGAVGPKFLYLDGRLQEAGVIMSPDGTAVQLGKGLDPADPMFNTPRVVDYCSAAALLMRKTLFDAVLGFDLCWDPAYYEDADLCLKLRLLGAETHYEPKAVVHHVENGTSSDKSLNLRLHDIVGINRLKFVSRWSRFLSTGDMQTVATLLPLQSGASKAVTPQPTFALYSPYPLVPGGGERYLLSLATALSDRFQVTLFTPERYSKHRIATMARELSLDLSALRAMAWNDRADCGRFDVFLAMGNELLPPVAGIGQYNLFHCQFPFPMHEGHYSRCWNNLPSYNAVVVNSTFTAEHYRTASAKLGLKPLPVQILYPPVPQIGSPELNREQERDLRAILHIGRFAPGGHCKRQDALIVAFKAALPHLPKGSRLRLAGSLGASAEARGYLAELQTLARGLPVSFHVNPTPEEISSFYLESGIYWHATGMGEDVAAHPERCEHFGITIAEAMSAGLIPVAFDAGGPAEIISHARNGFLVKDVTALAAATVALQGASASECLALRRAAVARALEFSFGKFRQRATELSTPALPTQDGQAKQPLPHAHPTKEYRPSRGVAVQSRARGSDQEILPKRRMPPMKKASGSLPQIVSAS